MPSKTRYYVLLISTLIGAFLLSNILITNLFIGGSPLPAWSVFEAKATITRDQFLASAGNLQQSIQQFISSKQWVAPPQTQVVPTVSLISYNQMGFFDTIPAPTAPLAPTSLPIPTQMPVIPTEVPPTVIPIPTSIIIQPTAPNHPTNRPTIKPTKTPPPTKVPTPTNAPVQVDFPKVVGDPLKQKWYANGSLACYTTERFIQVYANGLTPNACYANIRAVMDSSIVSTTLLGRSIQVHKKALPAFEAVSKTLDQYKVDSSTYKFPSKTYKIKNVGAYIFRCNVNASTSGKNDVCSDGCKLSPHAFGIGVDINYEENCNGCTKFDMPKEISDTFEMYGFRWGGHYPLIGSYIDPMHFEYMKDLCEGV